MPRYHFHIEDGREHLDDEGSELPSPEAARLMAARVLADRLHNWPGEVWDHRTLGVRVVDSGGYSVCRLELLAWGDDARGV